MENNVDNQGVTLSVKIYGYLLAFYPSQYRREFGPAMIQLFRDQCRDAWREAGGLGLAGLWLRTLPDVAKSSVREQFADWKKRSAFARVFTIAFCCSMGCAAVLANLFSVPYASTVKITVHRDVQNNPNFLLAQCKIIESYTVLTNAIATLHLDEKLAKQNHENRWAIDQTYDDLAGKISVKLHRETGVIDVSVKNRDPVLAEKIADTIARIYCYEAYLRSTEMALSNLDSFEHAVMVAKHKLSEAEGALFVASASASPNLKVLRAADEIAFSNYHEVVQAFGDAKLSLKLSLILANAMKATMEGATPALPIMGTMKILLIWLGAGTLVALIAGSIGAWISLIKRRAA